MSHTPPAGPEEKDKSHQIERAEDPVNYTVTQQPHGTSRLLSRMCGQQCVHAFSCFHGVLQCLGLLSIIWVFVGCQTCVLIILLRGALNTVKLNLVFKKALKLVEKFYKFSQFV